MEGKEKRRIKYILELMIILKIIEHNLKLLNNLYFIKLAF